MSEENVDPDAENSKFQDVELFNDLKRILPENPRIIDVGANRGQFGRKLLDSIPSVQLYCFEPVEKAYHDLCAEFNSSSNVSCFNKALSEIDGEIEFHVTESDIGSSILRPLEGASSKWLQLDHMATVESVRIDTFITDKEVEGEKIDLLKVDAQGHDLKVCRSAGKFLNPESIGAILVEVSFRDFYDGQDSFIDIMEALTESGYRLGWFYQHRSYDGFIWWADVLFLPRLSG